MDVRLVFLGLGLLAACSRTGNGSGGTQDRPRDESRRDKPPRDKPPREDTKTPPGQCDYASIGLASATPVLYRAPAGCTSPPSLEEPIVDEAGFQAAFACKVASGIDFTQHRLHVQSEQLSPATVGIDVLDDGKKLTFVSRQREPCPGEFPPMPVDVAVAYLRPIDGERETGTAMCKVSVPCS